MSIVNSSTIINIVNGSDSPNATLYLESAEILSVENAPTLERVNLNIGFNFEEKGTNMKTVFVAILIFKHDNNLYDCHIFKKPVTEDQAIKWFFKNSAVAEEGGYKKDFNAFDIDFKIEILESEI